MSSQFNAFEEALDFSFWRELCEKQSQLKSLLLGNFAINSLVGMAINSLLI